MLEKTLQKNIMRWCKDNGVLCYKVDSTSTTGFPDLVVITPHGLVYFVELKTPTGLMSEKQKRIHQKMKDNKARVFVVRSLGDFIKLVLTL
jgi:hypothetical protein